MLVALAASATAIAMLLVPAVAGAATSFTWTGEGPINPGWSSPEDWEGGSAPSGEVGTLTFPVLTSAVCTAEASTHDCYIAKNDIEGLEVDEIVIDDGGSYWISGETITVGSGGIIASGNSLIGNTDVEAPIVLSAPQTWSVAGNDPILFAKNVSGAADALNADLSEQALLQFAGDVQLGPVTVAGSGEIDLFPQIVGATASLNGTDGNPVSFSAGAGLRTWASTATGPLAFTGGRLSVGPYESCGPEGCEFGRLNVDGAVTLSSTSEYQTAISRPGTTPGIDYSQLSASGTVDLGGGRLAVLDEGGSNCTALGVGDVDTLITTTGALTGTFTGVPDGTVLPLTCSSSEPPTVRINYTAHAVTATVETAGSGEEKPAGGAPPPGEAEKHGAQMSGGAQTSAKASTAPAAPPVPVLAQTGDIAAVSGQVLVRLPGTSTFVALSSVTQIPFGTVIDATHGSVSVTTAGPHGTTQTVTLSEGEFVLTQGRDGMVVATLTGGDFSGCPTARERAHTARSASTRTAGKHVVRKLWAEGHGNFTTDGNYASASVRGTRWLTEDLCEGTLIHVATDRVAVVNRVNHRHVTVKAGHSYLAKAP